MGKNQWVSPRGDKWAVHGEKNSRDTSVHDTQAQAVETARAIAQHQRSELVVQGRDGKIRQKDSFGPDDFPPSG